MSIEATLVCDRCACIINAAKTAAKARAEAREQCGYRRIKRDDVCARCSTIDAPESEREVA